MALRVFMDKSKSIEELTGNVFSAPELQYSLSTKCFSLVKTPVADLNVENLRMLIGQGIALEFLIPLALDLLESDPLVSGAFYRGDLLENVVNVPESFWNQHPELNNRLVEVRIEFEGVFSTMSKNIWPSLQHFEFKNEP
ncbi:hypothetical protein MAH4_09860 [Sessilibacter sp. MAH4]